MQEPDEMKNSKTKAEFSVFYDGAALANNEMDVRELAPALLAIGSVIEEANNVINGDKVKVSVNVKASFKTGSFGIEICVAQSIFSQLIDFFNSKDGIAILGLLAILGFLNFTPQTLIGVIIWLRNRKIKSIETFEDGKTKITCQDEDYQIVDPAIINLLQNLKIRQSLERAITTPLEKEGFDTFVVKGKEEDAIPTIIKKNEAEWFRCPPASTDEIEDAIYNTNLQIVTLTFQDGNKWKVTDGTNSFYATVEDYNFLKKVNNSEISFSKGDILEAKVRKHVWVDTDGNLKAEYNILEIINHRSGAKQLKLF